MSKSKLESWKVVFVHCQDKFELGQAHLTFDQNRHQQRHHHRFLITLTVRRFTSLITMMDEFNSETDSDYTSYWRDWVGCHNFLPSSHIYIPCLPTKEANWRPFLPAWKHDRAWKVPWFRRLPGSIRSSCSQYHSHNVSSQLYKIRGSDHVTTAPTYLKHASFQKRSR